MWIGTGRTGVGIIISSVTHVSVVLKHYQALHYS